ncbi:endoplasmic reticulum-Golgi intermediate compartment protein 3-like [Herrania umbratica]|uniref:Endoplasmic reticulum-Golgi intermediate compartment protein 3-like n=1 Tax=Herrania umbratica TaxID=108875 RepID=A0A6J1AYF8_9ROSI|nr:endoplasmic reticulum-Golgi intermediate compartment protein 3-like [Herrania umbratica]
MENVFSKLRNLDAYPKVNEDFYSRTLSGGIITLVSSLAIVFLFFSEFRLYLHTVTETKLLVDTSRGEALRINFDVTFPAVPCTLLSLDAMDISGEQHLDIKHDIIKKRINAYGGVIESRQDGIGAPKIEKPLQRHGGRLEHNETYCGSCFGAEQSDDDCCNSCEEVREAYRRKGWAMTNVDLIDQCKREGFIQRVKDEDGEGCNIHGSLEVNKVAGNFHFAPGKSFHQTNIFLSDLLAFQKDSYNISHRINRLAFGEYFPGVVNPLDGAQWIHETSNGMYQYFIKVVPTIYTDISGRTVHSNQYSVTQHFKNLEFISLNSHPGVFFIYDFSPIKVTFKEEHISFLHFITNICAVIGGIFTVAGIIDSFVYHGQRRMKKKMDIGKFR